MPFSRVTEDREHDKFLEVAGETAVRVYDVGPGGGGGPTTPANTTPSIGLIDLPLANTEVSFALPANCKGFVFRSKKLSRIELSYEPGPTPSITIPTGGFWSEFNFYSSQTIYLKSSVALNEVQIVTFV